MRKEYQYLVGALVVVVAVIAVVALMRGRSQTAGNTNTYTNNQQALNDNTANSGETPLPTSTSQSTPPAAPAPQPASKTWDVTISDSGFSPSTVTIKKGDSVRWTNQASSYSRPASDPHPIHNGYPVAGGCVNSAFDACRALGTGDNWTFQFDVAGSWGYHDHQNPAKKGKVIVQ